MSNLTNYKKGGNMRIYQCRIEYYQTGNTVDGEYCASLKEKPIWVRAKNALSAHDKALHYKETGEVKKVKEVLSVELQGIIDKD
jgi:hypothetical protein